MFISARNAETLCCSLFLRDFPSATPFPNSSKWVSKVFHHQTCWDLIMGWFYAFWTNYFAFSSLFAAFWDSSHLLYVPIWPALCEDPKLPLKVHLSEEVSFSLYVYNCSLYVYICLYFFYNCHYSFSLWLFFC